jgi:hypothetical protein
VHGNGAKYARGQAWQMIDIIYMLLVILFMIFLATD